jgi:hypothetical protein
MSYSIMYIRKIGSKGNFNQNAANFAKHQSSYFFLFVETLKKMDQS